MSAQTSQNQRADAPGGREGTKSQSFGTNGGSAGTGGWPFWVQPTLAIGAVAVFIVLINATSNIMEAQRAGYPLDARAPFIWETSSALMTVAAAPLVGWAIANWPFVRERWLSWGAIHLAAATIFSVIHVLGMIGLRKLAYMLAGSVYDFSHGQPLLTFFYEWRKDVLTYALVAVTFFWFAEWRAKRAAPPLTADRLEIKDGARTILLDPAEILWVEAAGNYVELHTAAATHLARGALANFEARLAPKGFVRVHRSRLVNRARLRAMKPTPSGDLELTLDDGRTLAGSRRYRANLEAGPTL